MPFSFNFPMFKVIVNRFSLFYENKTLTILNYDPDNADESYRMGKYPLRGSLHPSDAISFR